MRTDRPPLRGSHTIDAFHRGEFFLVQPSARGHRAGIDALILAAAVPAGFCGSLADFGAGAGAAGLAVASRSPEARVLLVEQSAEMADFARETLGLPQNRRFADRVGILVADVTLAGRARERTGLGERSMDFVIMNPPFNAAADRATPDPLKREAHVMKDGLFENWLRSAAAVLKPQGWLALIARPQSLAAILDALQGRFGSTAILPVHPRPDAAAIRIVLRARRGARGSLSLWPPLVLHGPSGNRFSARADAILNGRAGLYED